MMLSVPAEKNFTTSSYIPKVHYAFLHHRFISKRSRTLDILNEGAIQTAARSVLSEQAATKPTFQQVLFHIVQWEMQATRGEIHDPTIFCAAFLGDIDYTNDHSHQHKDCGTLPHR